VLMASAEISDRVWDVLLRSDSCQNCREQETAHTCVLTKSEDLCASTN
jgi:hypothetical protein